MHGTVEVEGVPERPRPPQRGAPNVATTKVMQAAGSPVALMALAERGQGGGGVRAHASMLYTGGQCTHSARGAHLVRRAWLAAACCSHARPHKSHAGGAWQRMARLGRARPGTIRCKAPCISAPIAHRERLRRAHPGDGAGIHRAHHAPWPACSRCMQRACRHRQHARRTRSTRSAVYTCMFETSWIDSRASAGVSSRPSARPWATMVHAAHCVCEAALDLEEAASVRASHSKRANPV